jgi:hypothetical protein
VPKVVAAQEGKMSKYQGPRRRGHQTAALGGGGGGGYQGPSWDKYTKKKKKKKTEEQIEKVAKIGGAVLGAYGGGGSYA